MTEGRARRGYIQPPGCPHLRVAIFNVKVCVHRKQHKDIHTPCSSQDIEARCRDCGARLEYFGWNDFDKGRPARVNRVTTEYGHWRLQKAVEPSQERAVALDIGIIDNEEANPWRALDTDPHRG